MNSGWIKLHRKLWDNPIVTRDAEHLAVWIYLLTHASHNEYQIYFGRKKKMLKPGQLVTGRKAIAEATGVNESKVQRILKMFKIEQQIKQQSNRQGSLISIVNWNKYQISEQQTEQEVNRKRTESEHYQEVKECIEIVSSSAWLSDALTSEEWDRLRNTFQDVLGLIDYVDSQVVDVKEIKKPYKYILGVAEKKGWPRK